MPRPKPVTVGYDPEVDDVSRSTRADGELDSSFAPISVLPSPFVTRAVEWIAFSLWLGGQAAIQVIYSTAFVTALPLSRLSPGYLTMARGTYYLFGTVAEDIALVCACSAVLLILLTLREGYYARVSPLIAYLPFAGIAASLGLLVESERVRYGAYFGGFNNFQHTLHLLASFTDAQIALLCCVAIGLSWLQNADQKRRRSAPMKQ